MTLTPKSRVLSTGRRDPMPPEVRPAPTRGPLEISRERDAAATVSRNRFAGRSVALLVALAGLAGAAGCDYRESGNGTYAERIVEVPAFAGVSTQDDIDAVITVSSTATQRVTLTGDENIVNEVMQASVETETVGTTPVAVLRIRAQRRFDPVIPARVVITVPTLVLARGLRTDAGGTNLGVYGVGPTAPGPLHVELDGATLFADNYAVDGAVVDLDHGAVAKLKSNGPVSGSVSADSCLDNLSGTGSCGGVATSGAGNVRCP